MSARDRGVSTEIPSALDAEGPLRRWSRRKREAVREKEAADEARRRDASRAPSEAVQDAREPAGDAPAPATVEEQDLTDEDMPPIDSLDENSDYSGFLSPGVSEGLRRRALRKLFMSAVFNVRDGLDDYDEDFTNFEALGDIVTSDMKHQAEMEAERAKQAQAGTEPATGTEDESRAAEVEPPAPASDDAMVRAEAAPAGETQRREPAALAHAVPPDAVTDEDAARNEERSASPTGAGRGSRESVAGAGSPADAEAPDDVGASGSASGEASGSEESASPASHSEIGLQASAGSEVPANAGTVERRGA